MIEDNWKKQVTDVPKCKFDLCTDCKLYPCECIEEFTQFSENHSRDPDCYNADRNHAAKILLPKEDEGHKSIKTVHAESVVINGNIIRQNWSMVGKNNKSSTEFLSYDQTEFQNGCIMGPRFVMQVECGRKTVADGIGDHYKIAIDFDYKIVKNVSGRWEPIQPVVISAQTGQGKNYFIENFIIPYVESLNYQKITKFKVLIISNRLALKCQIDNHIRGKDNECEEDSGERIYSYKNVADVMTYQGLLRKREYLESVQKKKRSKYIFVICEEAHFFTSDAMFNPYTQKILSTIVSVFKEAVRIYMTATPYECLWPICECEEEMSVFYHFKRDYSYLDVKTFSEIRELYEYIVKTVEKKEKWLVFIDDKQKCQRVKNELEDKGEEMGIILQGDESKIGKIYAVSADSKKDEIYNAIVHEEKFVKEIQVLITTSVLDNGINLKGIDHIVLSDMSKIKCLQMVGRARANGNSDKKTLYLKRFGKKYVTDRIRDLKEQKQAYHDFDLAYGDLNDSFYSKKYDEYKFLRKYYNGDEKDWKNAKHWFGRLSEEPNQIFQNMIARYLMEKYLSIYKNIFQEMDEEQAEIEASDSEIRKLPGQKYLEYQLSWFGKKYCIEDDLTLCEKGKAENNFLNFLKPYADEKRLIDDKEKDQFKKEFTQLHDAAFPRKDKNKERHYGINVMNKIMKERNISYKVASKSKFWEVIEFDWNAEKAESD